MAVLFLFLFLEQMRLALEGKANALYARRHQADHDAELNSQY
jgi:hypothetical protein